MQFYPYFLKSYLFQVKVNAQFSDSFTFDAQPRQRNSIWSPMNLFSSLLNWEGMLWQQETESKAEQDQVEFETQNLQCLNRFQIWKLTLSHPWVYVIQTPGKQPVVLFGLPFPSGVPSSFLWVCTHMKEVNRFHPFPSERDNLLTRLSNLNWIFTSSIKTSMWWEKIK